MDYNNSAFGIATGTAGVQTFPDIIAYWARIKVTGAGFIGKYGIANYPLATGEDTGWFALENMNEINYKGSGTYFSYWYQF